MPLDANLRLVCHVAVAIEGRLLGLPLPLLLPLLMQRPLCLPKINVPSGTAQIRMFANFTYTMCGYHAKVEARSKQKCKGDWH